MAHLGPDGLEVIFLQFGEGLRRVTKWTHVGHHRAAFKEVIVHEECHMTPVKPFAANLTRGISAATIESFG